MSLAPKVALYDILRKDVALVSLLAADPNVANEPALFPGGSISRVTPVYPCLTYRASDGVPDKRFGPVLLPLVVPGSAGAGEEPSVQDVFVDMEAWTDGDDTAPVEAILARLKLLLHNVRFATTEGAVRSRCITEQHDLYDKTLNAAFALIRFSLHITTRPA